MKAMRKYAAFVGFECQINAYGVSKASEVGPDADCILVGPQIRYQVDAVKKEVSNVPVEAIDMKAYGMLDGEKVIAQAKRMMGI
ncbi:MAG: PTS sugar transporter subunit IIB [Lachnospiraceae bacterium]|nr:PTS sugar transporter subunit IIB [Lachnospiraceae bacterium]